MCLIQLFSIGHLYLSGKGWVWLQDRIPKDTCFKKNPQTIISKLR